MARWHKPGQRQVECARKMTDHRRYGPATARNRDFILYVLRDVLPLTGVFLEIASGSGEHVVHFARHLPSLAFQPSDPEPEALLSGAAWVKAAQVKNVCAPIVLDASQSLWPIASADGIICINMIHISPWDAAVGLIRGAAATLSQGSPLYLYGPYKRTGSQRPLPTKHSTRTFAIAIQPGVYEIWRQSLQLRSPLDSRSPRSPKCPQTI
jgi:hypothetical protein